MIRFVCPDCDQELAPVSVIHIATQFFVCPNAALDHAVWPDVVSGPRPVHPELKLWTRAELMENELFYAEPAAAAAA